jgi:hypothetical protein
MIKDDEEVVLLADEAHPNPKPFTATDKIKWTTFGTLMTMPNGEQVKYDLGKRQSAGAPHALLQRTHAQTKDSAKKQRIK